MRLLEYRRRVRRKGYVAFAKAITELAELRSGNNSGDSKFRNLWPCAVRRDEKTRSMVLMRWLLYRKGGQYVLKTQTLPTGPGKFRKVRAWRKKYVEAAKFLCEQIAQRKLRGILSLPYEPYLAVDERNENILRTQFEVLCATSYVGLMRADGNIHYGIVSLPQKDLETVKKRYKVSITSTGYRKLTSEIEEAYREFLRQLVHAADHRSADEKSVLFAADDVNTPEVMAAISSLLGDKDFGKTGIAPNAVCRLFKKFAPKEHPCFPKKTGGKRSPDRRDLAAKMIAKLAGRIANESDNSEEEGDDSDT